MLSIESELVSLKDKTVGWLEESEKHWEEYK